MYTHAIVSPAYHVLAYIATRCCNLASQFELLLLLLLFLLLYATAIYSVTMVLWKETAFPLCRAMERRWKRNVVSRVSSVMVVIRLPISCELSGHLDYYYVACTVCCADS